MQPKSTQYKPNEPNSAKIMQIQLSSTIIKPIQPFFYIAQPFSTQFTPIHSISLKFYPKSLPIHP